jgi:hypothetical protein
MTMRKILLTSVMGLSLALGACGQGDAGKDGKTAAKDGKKVDAKDAKKGDVKANDAKANDAKVDAKADGGDEPAEDVLDERVVKAAGLAKKIEAEPARADEILAEAGLDRTAFNTLIYEVSTSELAEQYRLARARDAG